MKTAPANSTLWLNMTFLGIPNWQKNVLNALVTCLRESREFVYDCEVVVFIDCIDIRMQDI